MACPRPPIAVIAGLGRLPEIIAEVCAARDQPVHVVNFRDDDAGFPENVAVFRARLERPGEVFAWLRKAGCKDVVFAGNFSRSRLNPAEFDETLQLHAARLMAALAGGDDGVLRAIRSIYETEGFRILGPHEAVTELLPNPSFCTSARPSEQDIEDGRRARAILDALGPVDVGQAVVVAGGLCVGIETIQGTDGLLHAAGQYIRDHIEDGGGSRGVLYKAAKPFQDRNMDMPTIGPRTVKGAQEAGLRGIVIAEGDVLMLDAAECVEIAEEFGMFIWVCRPDELSE